MVSRNVRAGIYRHLDDLIHRSLLVGGTLSEPTITLSYDIIGSQGPAASLAQSRDTSLVSGLNLSVRMFAHKFGLK